MGKTLEEKRAYHREYYQAHRDEILAKLKEDYAKNPEKFKESVDKYRHTPRGRAAHLLSNYNFHDKENGLQHGDLTADDVLEIIQQPCAHCRSSRMGNYRMQPS